MLKSCNAWRAASIPLRNPVEREEEEEEEGCMKQISDDEVNCTRKHILATRIQIKVCSFPLIRYNTTQQTIILLQKKKNHIDKSAPIHTVFVKSVVQVSACQQNLGALGLSCTCRLPARL